MSIYAQCEQAYKASKALAVLPASQRNAALDAMATAIRSNIASLLLANQHDQIAGKQAGLSKALIDRLALTGPRLEVLADSLSLIASLPDPLGKTIDGWTQPNGLVISKQRVPIGVVAIIYEARPNVTADAIALCIKTGNAVVLRGSSMCEQSNKALASVLKTAAIAHGVSGDAIQLLEDVSRDGIDELVKMRQFLSVVIPRGGHALIQRVVTSSLVPTIETGVGNCHIFIDDSADLNQAIPLVLNAKTQRPSVCNACETVLIHQDIASAFLPLLAAALVKEGVEIRGCPQTKQLLPDTTLAEESDWATEFLDLVLAIKVVASVEEAIDHIHRYGTHHSESILSNNKRHIDRFVAHVDAAAVLVNASTRFVDGGEFGFGAELGISTQKLHVRGPMGLEALTSYKYIVQGDGHIRG